MLQIRVCTLMRMCTRTWMLSHVQLFATLWNIAYQAPLSLGFSRQEYWSGFQFPIPGDLPKSETEPEFNFMPPALACEFFTTASPGKPKKPENVKGHLFLKNNFMYLFTYCCAGSLLLHRLSLVVASRGYSLVAVWQASHCVAHLVDSVGSRARQLQ